MKQLINSITIIQLLFDEKYDDDIIKKYWPQRIENVILIYLKLKNRKYLMKYLYFLIKI